MSLNDFVIQKMTQYTNIMSIIYCQFCSSSESAVVTSRKIGTESSRPSFHRSLEDSFSTTGHDFQMLPTFSTVRNNLLQSASGAEKDYVTQGIPLLLTYMLIT